MSRSSPMPSAATLAPSLSESVPISDAAKAYQSYGGIAGGMDGKVNFIYRTDAIEK